MSIENPNYHLLYEKIIKKGWGLDSVHNFRVYGYCLLLAESGVRFLIRQFLFVFCCTPSRLGTSAPSPRTRAIESAGRHDLEFAASAALGLVSRSRASLSLRPRARDQPSCRLAAPSRSTTLVLLVSTHALEQSSRA
jgi:hypothetical protein